MSARPTSSGPDLPPGTRLRAAEELDLDDLTDLWERAARTSHGFMADGDFADAAPYIRDALLPSMDVWVVEDGTGALGFAGARTDAGLTHLELLYVDPPAHGRGIGTALVDHVRPTSVEVYAGNAHGLGFYASHGFRPLRSHTHDAFGRPFPVVHLVRPG